jgi:hypothetical protein
MVTAVTHHGFAKALMIASAGDRIAGRDQHFREL